MEDAFIVEAYVRNGELYGDTYIKNGKPCLKGVKEYLKRNNLNVSDKQMLLVGRALIDFTNEDTLITKNNTPIYIHKFHLYGNEMDFIGHGHSCAIICSVVEDDFSEGDILKLR